LFGHQAALIIAEEAPNCAIDVACIAKGAASVRFFCRTSFCRFPVSAFDLLGTPRADAGSIGYGTRAHSTFEAAFAMFVV
jgi:hypothetical protein